MSIPADDPKRSLTQARSDSPNQPHIGLVGDTYTILLSGKDTAGRYSLIDMRFLQEAGHLRIATTLKSHSRCSKAKSKPPFGMNI